MAAAIAQHAEASYSTEKFPSIPVVQPPLTPQNSGIITMPFLEGYCLINTKSACLLCRSTPKNGEFDFCGTTCRDTVRNLAPLVLEVPQDHVTFAMGKPL
jgi:hypothetical protein